MSELADLLTETADRIFATAAPRPSDGWDRELWARIEESGLDRILLPEALGGAGDAFGEAVEVARRFGGHACAVPFVETLVANRCLALAGGDVAAGPKTILLAPQGIVAWTAPGVAQITGDGRTAATPETSGRTDLAGEPIARLSQAAPPDGGDEAALALYVTLTAAAMAGALQRAMDLTVTHVTERQQFGRPIGKFQAVQHMVARIVEEVAAAVAASQRAGRRLGGRSALAAAAIAKIRVDDAATTVAQLSHQCHGAIGFTQEYALARYTNRALSWRERAGSGQYWAAWLGNATLAAGIGAWRYIVDEA